MSIEEKLRLWARTEASQDFENYCSIDHRLSNETKAVNLEDTSPLHPRDYRSIRLSPCYVLPSQDRNSRDRRAEVVVTVPVRY
jgi:hypothetical protein